MKLSDEGAQPDSTQRVMPLLNPHRLTCSTINPQRIYERKVDQQVKVYQNVQTEEWLAADESTPSQSYNSNRQQLSMASPITLGNVTLANNPASFTDPISLEITFTAHRPISAPLQWKIIYVGSARNEQYDQILEEFESGPIQEPSSMKFMVDCPAPDFSRIPKEQLACITALILTVSFKKQEFIRIGFYVHNVLSDQVSEKERIKMHPNNMVKYIKRTILIEKPRITKFKIDWEEKAEKKSFFKEEVMKTPAKQIDKLDNSNSLAGSLTHSQDRASSKNSTREDQLEVSCLDFKLKQEIQPPILGFSAKVL